MSDPAASRAPVVIVGAGPVGLSLAIELGMRGVACTVLERNDRVGVAPRAKTTNVRTRTHLRRWGIAEALAEASPFGVDYPSDVFFVTRLGGKLLARIPNACNCAPDRTPLYPEHAQWIPQYKLEEVLRAHAASLAPVRLRFAAEFLSAAQDPGGVTVRLRDLTTGREEDLRAAYLVGADGARSAVRSVIGATMTGTPGLSRNFNIVFRAPGLARAHPHGPGAMYWQVNPEAPGLIGPMDRDDIWFFMPTKVADGMALSDAEAADLIRRTTDINLPYQILSRDEWVANRLIADRYRKDRIFLAGDACHLHPPFGGFGMNMGVSDAVDLGWKLAATIQGWGGPALLASYEIERRPVHERVMDEAVANHAVLSNDFWAEGLDDDGPAGDALRRRVGERIAAVKTREFYTLGTVLGICYGASPVIPAEDGPGGSPPDRPPGTGQDYVPSSRPGCLAPHMWMDGGASLYDRFGPGLTLLAGAGADSASIDRMRDQAAAAAVPLTVLRFDRGKNGPYDAALTLVRPDQHVGWRGNTVPENIVATVTGWVDRRTIAETGAT